MEATQNDKKDLILEALNYYANNMADGEKHRELYKCIADGKVGINGCTDLAAPTTEALREVMSHVDMESDRDLRRAIGTCNELLKLERSTKNSLINATNKFWHVRDFIMETGVSPDAYRREQQSKESPKAKYQRAANEADHLRWRAEAASRKAEELERIMRGE